MPEIHLPTAVKQDKILAKLNSVDQLVFGPTLDKHYPDQKLLEINGSGEIRRIIFLASATVNLSVEIDGVIRRYPYLNYTNNLELGLRFNTNLKIAVGGSYNSNYFHIFYYLD